MELELNKLILTLAFCSSFLTACNSGGGGSSSSDYSDGMSVTIAPGSAGICQYVNAPCVTVNVCDTGNSNCSTINNVLLDTGSYGLRVFNSTLSQSTLNNLVPVTYNSNPVGECVSYGDGSQNWGGIYFANIQLNSSNVASGIPIQIINSSFQTSPSACYNATTSPSAFGVNGILGVGVYQQDGGDYYSCANNVCSRISLPANKQVTNPISALPNNNNGLTISFPNVSNTGSNNISGVMQFGVNTNSNNTITTTNNFTATLNSDGLPIFNSLLNGNIYSSFLDSGTNTLGVSNSGLPTSSGFLNPAANTVLNITSLNSSSVYVNTFVTIASLSSLNTNYYDAFNDIGTDLSFGTATNYIDFGMPYFYGKTIQIVFNGKSSNIGDGPLWAW